MIPWAFEIWPSALYSVLLIVIPNRHPRSVHCQDHHLQSTKLSSLTSDSIVDRIVQNQTETPSVSPKQDYQINNLIRSWARKQGVTSDNIANSSPGSYPTTAKATSQKELWTTSKKGKHLSFLRVVADHHRQLCLQVPSPSRAVFLTLLSSRMFCSSSCTSPLSSLQYITMAWSCPFLLTPEDFCLT